jgi:tRNA(Ile2) C34 agmatinyltransferase TiaS
MEVGEPMTARQRRGGVMPALCPRCHAPLDGGPVEYRCGHCQRRVPAADLDVEYHPAPAEVTV